MIVPSSAIATVIVLVVLMHLLMVLVFDPLQALGPDASDLIIDVRTQHTLSLNMCFLTDRSQSEFQRSYVPYALSA